MGFIGEAIAIATVLCWTVSVQFFEAASKKVGSGAVNIIRLSAALLFFGLVLFVRDGSIVPMDFPARAWFYLSLSGLIGFFWGDIFLFKALVELGPRVAMLLHSLAAPTAAVIGWIFLGETYQGKQWFGIFITLLGVALVILERTPKTATVTKLKVRAISTRGILYGLAAMLGQAGGYVLSKAGMQTEQGYLDAFSSTQIRAIAGFAGFVLLFTCTGKWGQVKRAIGNQRALSYTLLGSFLGPFIGVSLSLLVLHYLATGVAATFLSLVPICIIPFSIFLYKEHVSIRAATGAIVAVFGVALLML